MTQSADSQGPEQGETPVEPPPGAAPIEHVEASAAASEPGASEPGASEPGASEPGASEAESEESDSEPEGEDEAAAEGGEATSPDGKPKKKRRRRRKKKKGEEGEVAAAGGEPAPAKKKDTSHLPFQRLFEGSGGRRHAFAVGEIVAGRVVRIEGDVGVVDLFGKALAFTRVTEPREIPIVHEVPEAASTHESTPEGTVPEGSASETAPEAGAAEASGVQAGGAEAGGAEAGAAEAGAHEARALSDAAEHAEHHLSAAEAPHDVHEDDEAEEPAMPAGVPELGYRVHTDAPPIVVGEIFRGRVGAVAESGHIALVNQVIDVAQTRTVLAHARDARARVEGLVFGFNRGGFDVLVGGLRAFCPVGGLSIESVEEPESLLGQWAQFHVQTAKPGSQGLVVSRRSILEKESRKRARHFLKSLQPGQTVRGRVTQIREFGLFVDIGGVEGLVHQSELSWERGVRPSDVAKIGDEIDVQVREVHEAHNKRERHERISLSLKALAADPWDGHADALTEGVPRRGTVVRTAEFGAFVQLAPGIDGLLHVSELGKDLKHAADAVNEGDSVIVLIERIDRKARRISLSKLSEEEAAAFEEGKLGGEGDKVVRVKVGNGVKVKVVQVGPAGIQVQVEGVLGKKGRGFIPNAEMGTPRGTDHRKGYPPGTELDVKIIGTDRDGGLRCSRKGFLVDEERKAVRDYRREAGKQGFGTFGDLLRSKLGQSEGPG